jgi:hypothetical protein
MTMVSIKAHRKTFFHIRQAWGRKEGRWNFADIIPSYNIRFYAFADRGGARHSPAAARAVICKSKSEGKGKAEKGNNGRLRAITEDGKGYILLSPLQDFVQFFMTFCVLICASLE